MAELVQTYDEGLTEPELTALLKDVNSQVGWAQFNYGQATYKKGALSAGLTCLMNAVEALAKAGATDNKEGYREVCDECGKIGCPNPGVCDPFGR